MPETEDDDREEIGRDELPDESDMDSHDEPSLVPCPHCRRMVDEDAEQCHHCGDYIIPHEAPLTKGWIIAIVALTIAGISGLGYYFTTL